MEIAFGLRVRQLGVDIFRKRETIIDFVSKKRRKCN